MLTEQEKDIIKQTVPLLKEKGTEITSIFYPKMFKAHPELLNIRTKNEACNLQH